MRSAIKRHGGKSYEARRIVALMPEHSHYSEPFFGSGAVLFAKDPDDVSETINDIDGELTNFWEVLRNQSNTLFRGLWATPPSQDRFEVAVQDFGQGDSIRRAANFFVRNRQSRQALGKDFVTPTTRIRRRMNEHVSAWLSAVDGLPEIAERLRQVEIRNMDVVAFIKRYDHEECVHYIDPPYMHDVRSATNAYGEFEMTRDDHLNLLRALACVRGKFLLSGYSNAVYDEFALVHKWHRVDIDAHNRASGSKSKEKTTECVWLNYELERGAAESEQAK